jgi:hypothetical protein
MTSKVPSLLPAVHFPLMYPPLSTHRDGFASYAGTHTEIHIVSARKSSSSSSSRRQINHGERTLMGGPA